MKPSLRYKMVRWLRRVRRRMYNLRYFFKNLFIDLTIIDSIYLFLFFSVHEKYQSEARNILNQKLNVDQEYVGIQFPTRFIFICQKANILLFFDFLYISIVITCVL